MRRGKPVRARLLSCGDRSQNRDLSPSNRNDKPFTAHGSRFTAFNTSRIDMQRLDLSHISLYGILMSDPISKANKCPVNPIEKLPIAPRQKRFALRTSQFNARADAYINVADIKHADRHDYLMDTNSAYHTFHIISVIFGAHDERTPQPYRGGLKKIVER